MLPKLVAPLGLIWSLIFAVCIVWIYASAPQSFSEAMTNAVQTAQIATQTYVIDEQHFRRGRELFLQKQFAAARLEWAVTDPAERDARVQFYVAYSFYREGWGRLYSDDALFRQGLAAVNRALALDDKLQVADAELKIKTAQELKTEFEQGLERTVSDFNPLRLTREMK